MKHIYTIAFFLFASLLPTLSRAQVVTNQFSNYVQGGVNSSEFTTNNFKCIGVGKGNVIWAGTQYGGLYTYSDTYNLWTKSSRLPNVFINDIRADADSGIWVAQSGTASVGGNSNIAGGVNYFPAGSDLSMEFYSVPGTSTQGFLISRNAKGLYLDQSKSFAKGDQPRPWVAMGTYITSFNAQRGGLAIGLNPFAPYFNDVPQGFTLTTTGGGVAAPFAECVGGDSREVWVGTRANGTAGTKILRYTPSGKYKSEFNTTNVPLLQSTFVAQAIFFDKFGNQWVGLKDGGLRIRKPDTSWVKMDASSFFPPGTMVNFNAITSDEYGNVYIGTSSGLLEYLSQDYNISSSPDYIPSYNMYTTTSGLPNDNITGLAYDKKNGKLLITTSGGVSFMEIRPPYIKGVVFDVYTSIDSTNNPYPGLQKKPLPAVTVRLLKNNVEEETTTTNASGIFELKKANDQDIYSVEVKYVIDGKPVIYVYSNIRNHKLLEPTLMPDSLIGEIQAFKAKLENRCFPIKLSFEQEVNLGVFCVDAFYTTGYDLATAPFFFPQGITNNHTKRVENLAAYYASLVTVYKLGGDAVSLDVDATANLLDAVEALGAFAEFFIKLKKPGNADPFDQILEDAVSFCESTLKAFKGTVIYGLTKASSFITDPEIKTKYDRYVSITGEVCDLLIEVVVKGKGAGVVKFLIDNLKKVVSQTIAVQGYKNGYARDLHKDFVYDRALAAKNLASPYNYTATYDELYNPGANSLAKYSTDTVTNRKASMTAATDVAKIADIASEVADAGSILAAVPGGQVAGAICKALSIAAKSTKAASLFYAMYLGMQGSEEVSDLSKKIAPKSALLRMLNTSDPTARTTGDADALVVRKNNYNQAISELQAVYLAPTYDQEAFKSKFKQFRFTDSAYAVELENTLNKMWSSADSANAKIPGFTSRLTTVVDSFVIRQGALRQAMFFQNAGYISTPSKSSFTAGLDSLCNELKVINDSSVNGIVGLVGNISSNNIGSRANLVQEGYSINHSRVPGTAGTITYTFVNRGGIAQNDVSFKIDHPTGGYNITSADSINVGTVQPSQSVQVTYAFTAPTLDSVGHYTIDVKAANGMYKDVYGAFYTIDPLKYYSVKNGNWHDPATWSSNTVPTAINPVYIYHDVSVTADGTCKSATLSYPGKIIIDTGKKLKVME